MPGRDGYTQGFTLIELVIIVAIIGILAAVLIPNLLRMHGPSNLNCYSVETPTRTFYTRNYTTQHGGEAVRFTDLTGSERLVIGSASISRTRCP